MTINELDQGLRNLIATQPMITSGMNGSVISGINSLIDAYRNLAFRAQSYPCQDVLKFGLMNELAKLDNSFSNMAFQVLQERGINLMLYVPRNGAQYGPMPSGYGMINTVVDQNAMMGQMMYGGQMSQPTPMMQMSNMGMQPSKSVFNTMQQTMPQNGYPGRTPSRTAPTYPGYSANQAPVKLEPEMQTEPLHFASAPQNKVREEPKVPLVNTIEKTVPNNIPAPSASKGPNPAEMLMGSSGSGKDDNAKGRDYLLELLKKK